MMRAGWRGFEAGQAATKWCTLCVAVHACHYRQQCTQRTVRAGNTSAACCPYWCMRGSAHAAATTVQFSPQAVPTSMPSTGSLDRPLSRSRITVTSSPGWHLQQV